MPDDRIVLARTWVFLFVVAGAALIVSAQPPVDVTAVVVDVDSPVENGAAADRLRDAALAGIGDRRAPYFELTSAGARQLPGSDADAVRVVRFAFQPPTYAGISVSFAESVEILRKNEAVRDGVIRRACGPAAARDCGAAVHAAASAMVRDTEAESGRKARRLVDVARTTRAGRVILITAGWPYADDRRLNLDNAVRELKATGSRIVVWKMSSAVPYQGLVRDASETIAARLSAKVVALEDERDIDRARNTYVDASQPAPPAFRPDTATAPAPTPEPALDRRFSAGDVADATIRRAAAYVARFEQTFSAVTWRERYQQEDRLQQRFGASGTRFGTLVGKRVLDSELLLLWLPGDASWIAVRDVIAVDGVPRPANDRRLPAALDGPAVSLEQLKRLATENGRFNIGQIVRTFNEPTLALLFLDDHHRHRFAFARGKADAVNHRRAATYEFIERARPTVIQDRDQDVPARGTLWVDEETGQVLQTLLDISDTPAHLQGRMTVRYEPHPKFDVLVPVEMRETYTSSSGEQITTVATYSDFRRFETAGRIIFRD